ncbi:MAG: hypothetical protein HDR77_02455 [Bacteroides sp.]|nr:hypothetical protein [Bacteroides sp.]
MRESLQKTIQNPTISDACKVRILTEEIEVLEERIKFLAKSRQDVFEKLAIAGAVMDRQCTKKYVAALAAQN